MENTKEIKKKKKGDLVENLVNLVGSTAGIILLSIGAIIFLNVFLKTYIFKVDNDRYSYFENVEERCQYLDPEKKELNKALRKLDSNKYPVDIVNVRSFDEDFSKEEAIERESEEKNQELTESEKEILSKEYQKCLTEGKARQKKEDWNGKGHQMAWGLAFLLVGLPLLMYYQNQTKKHIKNKK